MECGVTEITMTYLYRIDEHPQTFKFILRKFEVTKTQKNFLFVAPREINNTKAEEVSVKIRRSSIGKRYFSSGEQAVNSFIETREDTIRTSSLAIKDAEAQIQRIRNDIVTGK